MTSSNHIWFLMARCLNGEATPEETAELDALLAADEALQQQHALLRNMWQLEQPVMPLQDTGKTEDENPAARILQLARVTEAVQTEVPVTAPQRWYHLNRQKKLWATGIAALLLLCGGGVVIWHTRQTQTGYVKNSRPAEVIISPKGSRSQSRLPDGSVVWLNAGSSISYEEDFSGPVREVKLEGEAYFDVAKDAKKPFIVHTAGIDIKVLGTSFNVKAYASDKTVETTLIQGLVQVTGQYDHSHAPVLLHPNEKLVIAKTNATIGAAQLSSNGASSPQDTSASMPLADFKIMHLSTGKQGEESWVETAWLYNRLAFRGDSFEALAPKLERWYNIDIVCGDEKVKALNFNGSFENETVEQAFTALSAAVPFHFHIDGRKVVVSGAGN